MATPNFNIESLHRDELFGHIDQHEFKRIMRSASLIHLQDQNKIMFTEHDNRFLYYVLDGELNAQFAHKESSEVIYKGNWLGEASLITGERIEKELISSGESHLLQINCEQLQRSEPKTFDYLHSYIAKRLAHKAVVFKELSSVAIIDHIRDKHEQQKFGSFSIHLISIVCAYIILLHGFVSLFNTGYQKNYLNLIFLAIVTTLVIYFGKDSKIPISTFGLTTKNWWPSIKESLLITAIPALFFTFLKLCYVFLDPKFYGVPIFGFQTGVNLNFEIVDSGKLSIFLLYLFFAPLQELMARGFLQSSLYLFLTGTEFKRHALSIASSNLIFSAFHTHLDSIYVIFFSLAMGTLWGILYARQKTLIGVCVSHITFGLYTIFILSSAGIHHW